MTVTTPLDALRRPLRTFEQACAESSSLYWQAMGRAERHPRPVYMMIRAIDLPGWYHMQHFYGWTNYETYAREIMEEEGFESVEFQIDGGEWVRIG